MSSPLIGLVHVGMDLFIEKKREFRKFCSHQNGGRLHVVTSSLGSRVYWLTSPPVNWLTTVEGNGWESDSWQEVSKCDQLGRWREWLVTGEQGNEWNVCFFFYYWWPLILVFGIRCHFLFLLKLNQHVPQERSLSYRHFSPPGVAGRPFYFFFSFLLHCLYWLPSLWRLDCSAENQLTVAWKCAISCNAKPEDKGGGYTSSGRNSSLETDMIRQWKPPSQSGALS